MQAPRHRPLMALSFVLLAASIVTDASEPQSLRAQVNGVAFAGDDDTIHFVPLPSGAFSLGAATAGAASWPPPKTPIERLSITCRGFEAGKALKLGSKEFDNSSCDATFSKGASEAGKDADDYALDKSNTATLFEITAAHGKVIEGRFELHFKDKAGKALAITDGHFVAEDRQL
ncbi:hypothetical protein [Dokdonella sp.]|uniref:hypothetical protein n=1 Tax=Dokdonella sp. TaxID=2291710 RepID=UPI003783BA52